MSTIVSPSEVVVVSTFLVELDGGGGDMHITLPYSMIEPLREVLDAGTQSDVDDVDERWVRSLRADILAATVELHCAVAQREGRLRDHLRHALGQLVPVRS